MNRKILWSSLALAAVAGSGAALSPFVARGGEPGSATISTHEVARGRFVRRAAAEGYLKAVTATPITVPQREVPNGLKILWIADDGAHLRAGDPVVQFDPTELERSVVDSRDDRTSSQRKAEKARAQADAARGNLADDARMAAREQEHARNFTSQDESIFSRNEIIESAIDTELAAKKSDRAGWKIGKTDEQSRVEIKIHEIRGDAAQREMNRSQEALAALTVNAPHDGLLTLERNWRGETTRVGDSVYPGQKIAEIPDLNAMEARVFVLEADAGGLEPGRAAEVVLASRPEVAIKAVVSRVDAIAKPLRQGVPVQYFETILSLTPPPEISLKPGQRVRASILLEDVPDVLAVPRQAIFEKDGKNVVYRAEAGRLVPAEVKVGRYGLGSVLVEKGLHAGDRIALRDPAFLAGEIFEGAARGKSPGGAR